MIIKKQEAVRSTGSNIGKERKTIRNVLKQFDPTFEKGEDPTPKKRNNTRR